MTSIFRPTAAADAEAFLEQIKAPSFACELGDYIMRAFHAAREHRACSGVDREMANSLRAYKCKYNPEDLELLENPHEIYMGITNLKCRALQSWIYDILLPAEDRPWTLEPTPVPELPSRLEDIVVSRLALEFEQGGFEAEDYEDLAQEAKSIALEHAKEMAKEALERMETHIADQLEQGGWRDAFNEFIVDLSVYPSAILKGPITRDKSQLRWVDGKVVRTEESRFNVERVNPWDVYPSPNSKCTQSGTYIAHVARLSQTELFDCVGLYGFDEIAIRQLISSHPGGKTGWLQRMDHCMDTEQRTDSDAAEPDQQYHCVVYYGKIPARFLREHGIDVGDEDMHATVEAEVWVCGDYVLRAITNPYPLGKRPLYAASVQDEPGTFWGRSLPSLLHDVQRTANSAARALVKNLGFSAGPIGEYVADRLQNEEDITELQPYRMFAVDPDPFSGSQNAINFKTVENVSHRILAVYDRFAKEADDVSGIPAYALGSPQTAGAGRTLGGLSLLLGNAAKGVKRIIGSVDRGVIEPLIGVYYMLNLIYGSDETLKADAQVVARGSSGLLQRELSQSRALEVLQVITPYSNLGIVPPEAILVILRDVVSSLGYSADQLGLDDPQRLARLTAALAQVQPQGTAQAPGQIPPGILPTAPGTPIPQLDERSAAPVDPASLEALPNGF